MNDTNTRTATASKRFILAVTFDIKVQRLVIRRVGFSESLEL